MDNLGAWIEFEETCDVINSQLDESENDNKEESSPDSLIKIESRLTQLSKMRSQMVSVILFTVPNAQKFFRQVRTV